MVTREGKALVIAVLGLGEAGSVIARDLVAAGVRVRGYDPAVMAAGPVLDTASEADAARGAHLVLSVNSAGAAVGAFTAGLRADECHGERRDVLWADLNTASPGAKQQLAGIAEQAGIPFADVAMMAPVPGRGLRVPMLARRDRRRPLCCRARPLGAEIEVLEMGAAAQMLAELGVPPMMADASRALHDRLAAGG